jgi:TolB-like protein/class 3 adenylate cyclase/Flp pilus assembly protein TadD
MVKDRLSGKLAVILHADVANSTALIQQDKQLAHQRIQDSFRRFSNIIEKYQGHVLELRGDALLAEFERAFDAVVAVLSFQADQAEHNTQFYDDLRIDIRVGVTMGEVIVADSTVTGAGVVQAQRIEQLAKPGGLCITASIHEALSKRLPFDFESLGEKTLKGFEYPVRVYRAGLRSGEAIPPPQAAIQHEARPKTLRLVVVILSLALITVGGTAYWFNIQLPRKETIPIEKATLLLPDKPSIAVLPFGNMSGDEEQEYFVDGLTEDLITDLSRVSGLLVISRNSSFFYKEASVDVREVSRELGVKYVLEGSVRRAGDRVRINTQLINATTGENVWAERYDRVIENVFDLQDDITARILSVLEVKLTNKEQKLAVSSYTEQLDAYDSLLRGLAVSGYRSREANLEARGHYEKAIEIDPRFARAYAALANTYRVEYRNGWSTVPEESLSTAYDLVRKAFDLNRSSPQTNFVMSLIYREREDHKNAIAAAERAIELDPNYADGYVALASVLCYGGKSVEGLKLMQRAMRLNPHYPSLYPFYIGLCHFVKGNYKEAIDAFTAGAEQSPDSQRMHLWLAASHALSGNQEDAEWEASIVQTLNPDFVVKNLQILVPFKDPRHRETFVGGLRTAGLPG